MNTMPFCYGSCITTQACQQLIDQTLHSCNQNLTIIAVGCAVATIGLLALLTIALRRKKK